MTRESILEQRKAAAEAEIARLSAYIAGGCRDPWEGLDEDVDVIDVDLALVTGNGNDRTVDAAATVRWRYDRHVWGDTEYGRPFPVVEDVTVYAAVDGQWLPMRDVTEMLSKEARQEVLEAAQAMLDKRERDAA